MPSSKTHFRFVILTLLFAITVVNYIDRASIAYAIDSITLEFSLSETQKGLILGAFGIGYFFTTFLGGIAADLSGAKRTMAIAILFWGLTSFMTGIASGFAMIFIARALLGLAEGPGFPCMTRAVTDWLPENERNRALSFALISVPIALAIGGPIASALIDFLSWRGAYFILAGLALIWLPLWLWLFKDKPQQSDRVDINELQYIQTQDVIESHIKHEKNHWRVLFFNRTLLANNWAFFVFGYYLFFFMTWLPSYLKQTYNMDLTQIGWYSTMPWLTAALMMWLTGQLCDKIFNKTHNLRFSRSYPILITQILSAVFVVPVILSPSIMISMIFISLAVGFAMSANAAYYAVNIDIAKERSGTSLGIMDAVFALSGFIAPVLTGYLISWTGHFEAAFLMLAILALSSGTLVFLLHNKK